jgi:hypothetical protein
MPFFFKSNIVKKLSVYLFTDLNLKEKATFGLYDSPFFLIESSVSGANIYISISQPSP